MLMDQVGDDNKKKRDQIPLALVYMCIYPFSCRYNTKYPTLLMKYRNFNPSTEQPVSAAELLKKYNVLDQIKLESFDISKAIAQSNSKPTDEDLTTKFLKRFDNIANIINNKAIKKGPKSAIKHKDNLTEFDKYLKNKYPLADIKTEEKLTILLKERIKDFVDDRK